MRFFGELDAGGAATGTVSLTRVIVVKNDRLLRAPCSLGCTRVLAKLDEPASPLAALHPPSRERLKSVHTNAVRFSIPERYLNPRHCVP
jgi:hypothetical protein